MSELRCSMSDLRQRFPVGMTFGWDLDWMMAVREATSCARASRVRYRVHRLDGIWTFHPVVSR